MPASYNLHDPEIVAKETDFWEPKKQYIEKDLWIIRGFLTTEELNWLTEEANDPEGWYPTMRSPYGGNIRNKFLGSIPQYGEDGILIPPHPDNKPQFRPVPLLEDIEIRLESVLPKYFGGGGALQSFFEIPDEQIIKELGRNVDYAMDFHYERDESDSDIVQRTIVGSEENPVVSESIITAAWNVYINTNFDGGILEFRHKPYQIKPEPGMLINIPLYKEFEHRVTKVTNGNRHALYGHCWMDLEGAHLSSRADC